MQNYHYKQKAKKALRKRINIELANMPEKDELQIIKDKRRELFKAEKEYFWAGDIVSNYFNFLDKTPLDNEHLSKEDISLIENFKANDSELYPLPHFEYSKLEIKYKQKKKELEKLISEYTAPRTIINGVLLVKVESSNLLQIYFNTRKPSPAMREKLKNIGCVKSNFLNCYQCYNSDEVREKIVQILNNKRTRKGA